MGNKKYKTKGIRKHPLYITWHGMLQRCYNTKKASYLLYGGRGIIVHPDWIGDENAFYRFVEHIGPKPTPKHSIDRIDVDGNYAPGNVRWATIQEQAVNKRNNHKITWDNRTQTLSEWSKELSINEDVLSNRIHKLKWTTERALGTPTMPRGGSRPRKKKPNPNIGIAWPTDLELANAVQSTSLEAQARILGCSGNAVKKRLQKKGLYQLCY